MKYLSLIILVTLFSFGNENSISLQYTSLKYQENPVNDFVSTYVKLGDTHSLHNGDLDINIGISGLAMLTKSADFALFDTIHENKAHVDSLSLDWYPSNQTLISIGRQDLDINLLHGSFDGVLATMVKDTFSIKAFYFKHYSVLYPSYYKDAVLDKLYGLNMNYKKNIFESEASYFSYYNHHVSDIYMAIHPNNFTLGIEYLLFSSSDLLNEQAYKTYAGYHYKGIYIEGGHYNVYEGSLRNIYALGGSDFKTFRLNGFLDKNKAKNTYIDLHYNDEGFYTKFHLGYTNFNEENNQKYIGKELGVTLGKNFGKFELLVTYLTQISTQVDIPIEGTTWIQTHLKYRF